MWDAQPSFWERPATRNAISAVVGAIVGIAIGCLFPNWPTVVSIVRVADAFRTIGLSWDTSGLIWSLLPIWFAAALGGIVIGRLSREHRVRHSLFFCGGLIVVPILAASDAVRSFVHAEGSEIWISRVS